MHKDASKRCFDGNLMKPTETPICCDVPLHAALKANTTCVDASGIPSRAFKLAEPIQS